VTAAASPPNPANPPNEGGDAFAEELTSRDLVTTGEAPVVVEGTPLAKPLSVLTPPKPKPKPLLVVVVAAAVLKAVVVSNADPELAAGVPNADARSVLPNPTVAAPLTGAAAGLIVGDLDAASGTVFLESYDLENAADEAGGAAGLRMGEKDDPDEEGCAEPKWFLGATSFSSSSSCSSETAKLLRPFFELDEGASARSSRGCLLPPFLPAPKSDSGCGGVRVIWKGADAGVRLMDEEDAADAAAGDAEAAVFLRMGSNLGRKWVAGMLPPARDGAKVAP
jgi:hypothetical protein